MLSDCYAHGYGVHFIEALEYLKQATSTGSLSAEAILLRIAEAIEGCISKNVENASEISICSFLVRKELRDLEKRLCTVSNAQNLSARLKEWAQWASEEEEKSVWSITDEEGHVYTVEEGNSANILRLLESKAIKNVGTATVEITSQLTSVKSLLIHAIAGHGWTELLDLLTQGNDLLYQTIPVVNNFGEISNPSTLVLAASMGGRAMTIRYLLRRGAPASKWEGPLALSSMINGLHLLFIFNDEDIEDIGRLLVEQGADPNMVGQYSNSLVPIASDFPIELSGPPLDVAIWVGDVRAVQVLLRLGADPLKTSSPTPDKQAHNCLELAVALHLYEIVNIMLDHLLQDTGSQPLSMDLNGLLTHVSGMILGGKGMFRRWLIHGLKYKQACRKSIETCLKHGLFIDSKDESGLTALLVTAYHCPCQSYVVEALLEYGADPNARNPNGGVPLMQCCRAVWDSEDNARNTRHLIKFGADVNATANDGQVPAHFHAYSNSVASLRALIDSGATLERTDSRGWTPLFSAAHSVGVESVELLLDRGANIDAESTEKSPYKLTPLGLAVAIGKTKIARVLLDRGASIIQPEMKTTVLHIAALNGHVDVLRVLLRDYRQLFCAPNILNGMDEQRNAPIHDAATQRPHCLEILIQAGADIDFRDPDRAEARTSLAVTIEVERLDLSIYLLEKGASAFCRGDPNEEMWSFLNEYVYWCGVKHGLRPRFFDFLLKTKPWIDKNKLLSVRNWAGQTILQAAVHHGQLDAVKALVEIGASLEDRLQILRLHYWENDFWEHYHIDGLSLLQYAKVLRNSTEDQKTYWMANIPYEITNDDMDAIIQYLMSLNGCS